MFKKAAITVIALAATASLLAGIFAFTPTDQAFAQAGNGRGGYGGGSGAASTYAGAGGYGMGNATGYRGYGAGQLADGNALALGPLSEAEAQALERAVQEEYGALALYQGVLDAFGNVIPFSYVARAEAQHAAALVRLADRYGVAVPQPSTTGAVEFATLSEACQAGVEAEIADAALYDELMAVTAHSDLLRVYTNLQRASLENHLPAFDACR